MANKAFYVTREETEGQPAGEATLNRADKPQLLKIVPVDNAGKPNPAAEPENNQIYATEEENQEILFTSDTVQEGDYNPVTSDAVFKYAKPPHPDWANAVAITLAQLTTGYMLPDDGMVVGYAFNNQTITGPDSIVTINGVIASIAWYNNTSNFGIAYIQCPINKGDILKGDGIFTTCKYSFVPWK